MEASQNQNVVSASVEYDRYGLLNVSFVCEGRPEWPTALRAGKSSTGGDWTIRDNPLMAFRNGNATAKCAPQYSYHRSNRQVQSWVCRSLLFSDGSPYSKEEQARDLTAADKMRIFQARVINEDSGLKCVEFRGVGLIGGKAIYPTALAEGKELTDNPIDAFFGGEKSIQLPLSVDADDDDVGVVWTARTYLAPDGSALGDENKKLLISYGSIVDFPVPGKIDIFLDTGPTETPPTNIQLPATVSVYIATTNGVANLEAPYCVKRWCKYGSTYVPKKTLLALSEGGAARGYLAGDAWAGAHTTYKNTEVTSLNSWLQSDPTYAVFVQDIAAGKTISRQVRLLFASDEGKFYFLITEVYVQAQL